MKTFREFLSEQASLFKVTKQPRAEDMDDNDSDKHDVVHNGNHIASIYHHPAGSEGNRWEVMKPHDNKEWADNYGDTSHDSSYEDNFKTKQHAVDAIKSRHKIT